MVVHQGVGNEASHSCRHGSTGEVSHQFGAKTTSLEGVFHQQCDFGLVFTVLAMKAAHPDNAPSHFNDIDGITGTNSRQPIQHGFVLGRLRDWSEETAVERLGRAPRNHRFDAGPIDRLHWANEDRELGFALVRCDDCLRDTAGAAGMGRTQS